MPTYDGVEFEIRFDGVNRGDGSDLLCIPHISRTNAVDALATPAVPHRPVSDLLPLTQEEALTTRQIMVLSGANYGVVNQALYRMRSDGRLRWALVPGRCGSGQRPRVYWQERASVKQKAVA